MAASFFFRGRRKESTSAPVIVPWRAVIALMMSRGDRWRVSVSGSEIARRFDSHMLSRIAAQKAAETANQADLAAVARLKASRTAGPSPAARSAGAGKSGLARNGPPGGGVEDSPDRVVAYAEQETKFVPFSEHGARGSVEGDLPRHQIGAWMIVEGGCNTRVKG
jgi:hypothetical protein